MDFGAIGNTRGGASAQLALEHMVPYGILLVNYLLFRLLRNLINRLVAAGSHLISQDKQQKISTGRARILKLFTDELISTCELCADCAELNVVYERHGAYAYGLTLFVLSYLWIESFGEAYTSPGYLAEDYFLIEGNSMLKTGDAYARFVGQSLAMPLAWRLASLYWRYHLIGEHQTMADTQNCKSSLATSTTNGFLIELACCLLCRLTELIGHKLLERRHLGQRAVSAACSFFSALLVVLALESSGGYFHPILAASLEYGCKGIEFHQHALVFWLGPLLGHLLARGLFRRLEGAERPPAIAMDKPKHTVTLTTAERRKQIFADGIATTRATNSNNATTQKQTSSQSRRMTRSNSQRKKRDD